MDEGAAAALCADPPSLEDEPELVEDDSVLVAVDVVFVEAADELDVLEERESVL